MTSNAMIPVPTWARGLENKTAVVTGASRGLGRAISEALCAAGAQVIAVARGLAELEDLAASAPGIETC